MIEREKFIKLPENPGVYIFYDKENSILYIGKAKNLKKRVSQYFNNKKHDLKTLVLVKRIKYIDYLITKSENEALLIEQNLISVNNPPFNIQLKDNKSFPVIVLTDEEFPAIHLSRQYNSEKGNIYGPYLSSKTAKKLYQFVVENFKIRSCYKKLNKASNPCLNYHLNLCFAPCKRNINSSDYSKFVEKAKNFLSGAYNELLKKLKDEIEKLSKDLQFEKALELKTMYEKIANFNKDFSYNYSNQNIVDFISFFFGKKYGVITLLRMDRGRKIYPYTKYFKYYDYPKEIFPEILIKLYKEFLKFQNYTLPSEIISLYDSYIKINSLINDSNNFNNAINDLEKEKLIAENLEIYKLNQTINSSELIKITNNKKKYDERVILVRRYKNIKELEILKNLVRHCYTFYFETFGEKDPSKIKLLKSLKEKLNLNNFPEIIEGFDISNIGDKYIVGSEVNFKNGVRNKKEYRHYSIKTVEYQNDVESLTEVVLRRIIRLQNEKKKIPDLILLDGGKPQANSVYNALKKIGVQTDVIGLAKKEEIIYIPQRNEFIKIDLTLPELKLLIKIRDEAHRFANRLRKIKINKRFNF